MQEKEVGASIRDRTTSPTDKVVPFQTTLGQTTKPKKDYSLGFIFPGNCVEIHREIKIFDEEMEKSCQASPAFKVVSRIVRLVLSFATKKSLEQ